MKGSVPSASVLSSVGTDMKFQLSIGESYGAPSSQDVLHIAASEDYRKEPRLQIDRADRECAVGSGVGRGRRAMR